MFEYPIGNYEKDVIYHCIGDDFDQGVLSCGYMPKLGREHAQIDFQIQYYSCFVLLNGSGYYEDSHFGQIKIQAGDLVQRFPGVTHSTLIDSDGQWLEFYLSIGHASFDALSQLNLLNLSYPVLKPTLTPDTLHHFDNLLYRLKEADEARLPFILLDVQSLILQLHRTSNALHVNPWDTAIIDAQQLLSSHLQDDLSLEAIAKSVHLSYEHFRKLFKQKTGLSPARFRIEQRIKQAKLLLLSQMSIKETAQLVGYQDTYAFTKQFTKSVGLPPGRYLKRVDPSL